MDFHIIQRDTILRTFGAGERGHDVVQIELDPFAVVNFPSARYAVHILRLIICFKRRDFRIGTTGFDHVIDGFVVDRKKAHGRAVFGCHIGNRRAISNRQTRCTLTIKLDELTDHFGVAQRFGYGQDQIGRGHAFHQSARQFNTDHIGGE